MKVFLVIRSKTDRPDTTVPINLTYPLFAEINHAILYGGIEYCVNNIVWDLDLKHLLLYIEPVTK